MATLTNSKVDWQNLVGDYDRIRDKIEIVYPDFKNYNERIRQNSLLPQPPPTAFRSIRR